MNYNYTDVETQKFLKLLDRFREWLLRKNPRGLLSRHIIIIVSTRLLARVRESLLEYLWDDKTMIRDETMGDKFTVEFIDGSLIEIHGVERGKVSQRIRPHRCHLAYMMNPNEFSFDDRCELQSIARFGAYALSSEFLDADHYWWIAFNTPKERLVPQKELVDIS